MRVPNKKAVGWQELTAGARGLTGCHFPHCLYFSTLNEINLDLVWEYMGFQRGKENWSDYEKEKILFLEDSLLEKKKTWLEKALLIIWGSDEQ